LAVESTWVKVKR